MKLGKKFTLLFSALVMAGAVLTACSSSGNNGTNAANGGESPAPQASGQPAGEDKTPIKVNWFIAMDWYKRDWNPEVNLMDKKLFEELGVEINFTSGSPEKLSAMIATGDIPDLITLESNTPQRGVLEKSGYVLPMDELLPKYAPDLNVPETVQSWFRTSDNHYYGLPNYFYAPEQMKPDNFFPTHNTMRARDDLMKKLSIDASAFETKEGTLEALRKVRDAKLKYNGFDVVPGYFFYDHLVQFFGAKREDAQGNYVDSYREPESLETFKFLNQLYREGLMPQDALTLTRPQVQEKVNAGGVFMYTNWLVKWQALGTADPNAFYVPVGPIKGDEAKPFHFTPSTVSGWTMTMVGKSTKHEARIAKMIQYLSQDEMSLEMTYGPKGVAWDYDANGHVKFTEQWKKDYDADAESANLKYVGFDWLVNWLPIQAAFPVPETTHDKWEAETEKYFSKYSYNTMAFEAIKPDGGTDLAAIDVKIADYRTSMGAKMVLAKSPEEVERIFNSMVEQERKLGYDQLFQYWNQKFIETKKKLGIEFAWPDNQK
ncbi:extracellular solute-binding protein [Paenibacillus pasadenensis]|uniref:extracellular solute-binding protein n=1 Tax=Paenibacillus pasadenensis TaxID=217090 RepID=UPI00203CA538|nr:extracellular solute-binding protein [Paenibacillus pasadenensis]MCM3747019.1 extracellular solute-binding protein [Paenibacillus pasadenensis]